MKWTTIFCDQKTGRWKHILLGSHLQTLDEAISEATVLHRVPKANWNARGDTWARCKPEDVVLSG